jgi:hypothetical protein
MEVAAHTGLMFCLLGLLEAGSDDSDATTMQFSGKAEAQIACQ